MSSAALVYYPSDRPGISRRRCGRGFTFTGPDGVRVDGPARTRLLTLAIPPAWERVWICPKVNGHLQATGYDARARKQYMYHPDWAQARALSKYDGLAQFGRALPALRRRILRDLATDAGEPDFALAAAVALIDRLSLRVGNREYADENGSFGATTLQRRHMRLADGQIRLSFVAKGGKRVRHSVSDKRLMAALEKARDLPGAELFGWIDADGAPHSITSSGVNAYLDNGENAGFTAKTFRTWSGTLAAFECVTAGRTTIAEMAQAAADRLGNTPGIARKSYIHPQVLDLAGRDYGVEAANRINGLSATEARLLAFLDRQG